MDPAGHGVPGLPPLPRTGSGVRSSSGVRRSDSRGSIASRPYPSIGPRKRSNSDVGSELVAATAFQRDTSYVDPRHAAAGAVAGAASASPEEDHIPGYLDFNQTLNSTAHTVNHNVTLKEPLPFNKLDTSHELINYSNGSKNAISRFPPGRPNEASLGEMVHPPILGKPSNQSSHATTMDSSVDRSCCKNRISKPFRNDPNESYSKHNDKRRKRSWWSKLRGCGNCGSGFIEFKAKFLEKIETYFESYGHAVYDHPWRFIVIPIILCFVFSGGFFFRRMELDMVRLYGLPGSESLTALQVMQNSFPVERLQYVLAVDKRDQNAPILSYERLTELAQFWTKLKWLHVPRELASAAAFPDDQHVMRDWLWEEDPLQLLYEPDFDVARYEKRRQKLRSLPGFSDQFITLEEVCVRDGFGLCKTSNVLDLYANPALWGTPLSSNEFPQFVNKKTLQGARIDSILGGMTLHKRGHTTMVTNATSAMFRIDVSGSGETRVAAIAWEQGLLAMARSMKFPNLALYVKAERSVNDELALSSLLRGEDLAMLCAAAIFVTLFTVTMNSSLDLYRSKALPAFIGVTTTLLSYGGGVGLCHWLGLPHVPPAEATPFIVLAINVDDIFVLTNAYSMTYLHSRSARTRMGLTMKDAGISVTLTTVTNIVAFSIGASTCYYAIRVFCIVTAAALVAGYLLALTVFFGSLALSAKLEQENRPGPLICPTATSEKIPSLMLALPDLAASSQAREIKDDFEKREQSKTEPHSGDSRPCSGSSAVAGIYVIEQLTNQYVMARRVARAEELRQGRKRNRIDRGVPDDLRDQDGCSLMEARDLCNQEEVRTPPRDPSIELTWLQENSPTPPSHRSFGLAGANQLRLRSPSPSSMYRARTPQPRPTTDISGPSTAFAQTASGTHHGEIESNAGTDRFDVLSLPKLVAIDDMLIPEDALQVDEPPGTVGRWARRLEMRYIGPFLMNKFVKLVIVLLTLANFAWSMNMCFKVKSGIQVEDVTPFDSYLRETLDMRGQLYDKYGEECIVYFGSGPKWWEPEVQAALKELTSSLEHYDHVAFVLSGMDDFMRSRYFNKTASDLPTEAERKEAFMTAFEAWRESARGRNFGKVFEIQNGELKSWKFYYWLQYSTDSHDNHIWQKFVQTKLRELRKSDMFGDVWTWSALSPIWESDPIVFRATMTNMIVAMISMGAVAIFLIPDLFSSFLVLGIIVLIYTNVYGYMYLWGLHLNMLTMVNLVLAIGFAVDYTAHMTHCFNHCKGLTRNRRATETFIMMGLPVTNGMLSTYAAVITLCLSHKYIMIVIFEMTITIIASAFWHGGIFMPVLLSLIGPMQSSEVEVVEMEDGKIQNIWTVAWPTGKVIHEKSLHAERRAAELQHVLQNRNFRRRKAPQYLTP